MPVHMQSQYFLHHGITLHYGRVMYVGQAASYDCYQFLSLILPQIPWPVIPHILSMKGVQQLGVQVS